MYDRMKENTGKTSDYTPIGETEYNLLQKRNTLWMDMEHH
jgi:hypothetical protein